MSLRFESVGFSFGRREVLRDVSFDVRLGETVGVIGTNGAGKTTLLRLGAGTARASRGTVRLGERPIEALGARERARRVAMMEQVVSAPMGLTVQDVVEMARLPHRRRFAPISAAGRAAVADAMALCEVDGLARRLADTLSGGEYRRVLLAATLAQEAPTVLLDEPFAHLDPAHVVQLTSTLARLRDNARAFLIAAHEVNAMLRVATRIVALAGGTSTVHATVDDAARDGAFETAYGPCVEVRRAASGVWVEPRFDRPGPGSASGAADTIGP